MIRPNSKRRQVQEHVAGSDTRGGVQFVGWECWVRNQHWDHHCAMWAMVARSRRPTRFSLKLSTRSEEQEWSNRCSRNFVACKSTQSQGPHPASAPGPSWVREHLNGACLRPERLEHLNPCCKRGPCGPVPGPGRSMRLEMSAPVGDFIVIT